MEQRKLTPGETEALVQDVEDRQLLRWYGQWKDNRIGYALVQPLLKLPIVLLVWIVVQWRTGVRTFLSDPWPYFRERIGFLVLYYLVFVLLYYYVWRQKAFEYHLRSAKEGSWPQPDADSQLVRTAEQARRRVERLHRRWGGSPWKLILPIALLTPIVGLLPILIATAFHDGRFHWQDFVDGFEGGYSLMAAVAAIFLVFGGVMGRGIWKQIRDNHQLLSSTPLRER